MPGDRRYATRPPSPETLEWALRAAGSRLRLVSVRPLRGSEWQANHVLRLIDGAGRPRDLVLRRWARPGWDALDPDFDARREATVLSLLATTPVVAPRLVAADADAQFCDYPALLITRLPGHPPAADASGRSFVRQLAEALAGIHRVDGGARQVVPPYRPWHIRSAAPPGWLPATQLWTDVFALAADDAPEAPESFIHRDYHHGNTLWRRGRLTGIVDWTTGSFGPSAVDLAHARWNLAVDYGLEAAQTFLEDYRAITRARLAHQRYWDAAGVVDLLGVAGPDSAPAPASLVARLERYLSTVLRISD